MAAHLFLIALGVIKFRMKIIMKIVSLSTLPIGLNQCVLFDSVAVLRAAARAPAAPPAADGGLRAAGGSAGVGAPRPVGAAS